MIYGDLIELGQNYQHRVLCGDSTNENDVKRLMNSTEAELAFTDPPYNLGFEYNSYDDNKTDEEYKDFSKKWFLNLKKYSNRQIVTMGVNNIHISSSLSKPTSVGCWIKKNWISSSKIAKLQQWEPIFFYGDFSKYKRTSDLF